MTPAVTNPSTKKSPPTESTTNSNTNSTPDHTPNSTPSSRNTNGTPVDETAITSPESGPDITSAIIGASITVGILLLLIVLAIMVLINCVLLGKKRKSPILNLSELTATESAIQATPAPPTNYELPSIERNSIAGVWVITERNPQDLSELSLPVPPLEPELIPLEVWKQENDSLPVYNSHYASTAAENSNLSEPPDYESIQDVKQHYTLAGGNSDLSHPHHGLHNESSCVVPLDRSGVKRDLIRVNKMTLLPEEDSYLDEKSFMFTAENSIIIWIRSRSIWLYCRELPLPVPTTSCFRA